MSSPTPLWQEVFDQEIGVPMSDYIEGLVKRVMGYNRLRNRSDGYDCVHDAIISRINDWVGGDQSVSLDRMIHSRAFKNGKSKVREYGYLRNSNLPYILEVEDESGRELEAERGVDLRTPEDRVYNAELRAIIDKAIDIVRDKWEENSKRPLMRDKYKVWKATLSNRDMLWDVIMIQPKAKRSKARKGSRYMIHADPFDEANVCEKWGIEPKQAKRIRIKYFKIIKELIIEMGGPSAVLN